VYDIKRTPNETRGNGEKGKKERKYRDNKRNRSELVVCDLLTPLLPCHALLLELWNTAVRMY
jgi:hypothetical protein